MFLLDQIKACNLYICLFSMFCSSDCDHCLQCAQCVLANELYNFINEIAFICWNRSHSQFRVLYTYTVHGGGSWINATQYICTSLLQQVNVYCFMAFDSHLQIIIIFQIILKIMFNNCNEFVYNFEFIWMASISI